MIKYNSKSRKFAIHTKSTSYFMQIDDEGVLRNLYFGKKINSEDCVDLMIPNSLYCKICSCTYPYRAEYIAKGKMIYDEPCINARFFDGTEDVRLVYSEHKIQKTEYGEKLTVVLKDEVYPFAVELGYETYGELDLIGKSAVIKNIGKEPVTLTCMKTGTLYPEWHQNMRIMYFAGNWGAEYQKEYVTMRHGKFCIDNRRGTSSGPQHIPFFALDNGSATETSGEVWYGSLHWSGNFKIDIEQPYHHQVTVTAGVNNFDCDIELRENDVFETPQLTIGFSDGGYEKMSEQLYDFQYDYLIPHKNNDSLSVIYNTWYPYELNVNEQNCLSLIDRAKEIGAELFVIDDGWFADRNIFSVGLGDWYVNKEKFPNGLKPIADKAHSLGMKFGLWIEPEMVNESSNLYKKHPEWVLSYPNREKTVMRHQYVLNLAREDVKEFVWETIKRIVSEYALDYIKWDMNTYITETGVKDGHREICIRYIKNLYDIREKIEKTFPDLIMENCAHGGARADFGMLKYSDRINRSDNNDPLDSLKLHEGFSTVFIPKYAGGAGNMPNSPNRINHRISPLKFRAFIGMTGAMSIGINLLNSTQKEIDEIKKYIEQYKEIREIIRDSYVYRLSSAFEYPYTVWEYLSRDRNHALVFVFSHGMNFRETPPHMKLRGLSEKCRYRLTGEEHKILNWKHEPLPDRITFGDGLMNYGVQIEPMGDFDCQIIRIDKM